MRIPVSIYDELSDKVIEAEGLLDLDSGEITSVKYIDHDISKHGLPFKQKDYEFTSGILRKEDKEMEFTLVIENGQYSVNANELAELKEKSIKLFAAANTPRKKRI